MQYLNYMGEKIQQDSCSVSSDEKNMVANQAAGENQGKDNIEKKSRWGNGAAQITKIQVLNSKGEEKRVFATGEDAIIKVWYTVKNVVPDADFGIGIFRNDGIQCYGTNTRIEHFPKFDLSKDGVFELQIDSLTLLAGKYWIDLAIESSNGLPVDYFTRAFELEVFSPIGDVGVCRIRHKWQLQL